MTKRERKPIADLSIESEWKEYADEVIPAGASSIQLREMKNAFYAGAACMLSFTDRIGQEDVTEEEGVKVLEELYSEVRAFVDSRLREAGRMEPMRRAATRRPN